MRHDWDIEEIRAIYQMPLLSLVLRASEVHRSNHREGEVQCCQIINVKVGGCEEDCSYCAQSSRYTTHISPQAMLSVEDVVKEARGAKEQGITRVCLSAAWREVKDGKAFNTVLDMVTAVKAIGVEVCSTLGMLEQKHIDRLKDAGIYAINHNLDTSPEFYDKVITTRNQDDRLDTIARVRASGVTVCSGGIIGMGESLEDRLSMLQTLSSLDPHPESVPINLLVRIPGTPLEKIPKPTAWELIRMVATARIMMPGSMVRLSGGRIELSLSQQALCFLAGANSIHVGPKLLITKNPEHHIDRDMFRTLGLSQRPPYDAEEAVSAPLLKTIEQQMKDALDKRHEQGIYRSLSVVEDLVDLTSNDYLGLARSQPLLQTIESHFRDLVKEGGIRPIVGATGSRLLTGNTAYVETLESDLATFHRAEAGLLFNSGYTANVGLLGAVINKNDTIILDTQVHASTWEGAKVSGARQMLFRHNDTAHLSAQLKKVQGRVFVCVESLYSMNGDIAPLDAICDLCDQHGAHLIVDEAHATGLFGPEGRGIVSAHKLEKRVFARLHTFGKALGMHGAIVLGSQTLRDFLVNFSRPLIYTTAFPLHTLVSIRCAYEAMRHADAERQHLQALIHAFKTKIIEANLSVLTSSTPIQSIRIGNAERARMLSGLLASKGLDVRAILSPTVRRGEECLRICLHAFNQIPDLERLVAVLARESEQVNIA